VLLVHRLKRATKKVRWLFHFGVFGEQIPFTRSASAMSSLFVADAHRDDGKRYIVRTDEKLTAFLELERAVCIHVLTEQV